MRILFWVAMIIPPWNIFWWFVGFCLYQLRGGRKADPSGDIALSMVVYAPVYVPLMPFMFLRDKLDQRKYRKKQESYAVAAEWIEKELRSNDIEVIKSDVVSYSGCAVEAKLADTQIKDYQNVYAAAIKRFPHFSPSEICNCAKPLEPLNEAWAEKLGIGEYAAKIIDMCSSCGIETEGITAWGPKMRHKNGWFEHSMTFRLNVGEVHTTGFLCYNCTKRTEELFGKMSNSSSWFKNLN